METGSVPKCSQTQILDPLPLLWSHYLLSLSFCLFIFLYWLPTSLGSECFSPLFFLFNHGVLSLRLHLVCGLLQPPQPLLSLSSTSQIQLLSLPAPHSSWFPVHTPIREKLTGQACFSRIWSQPQSLGNFGVRFLCLGGHSLMECTLVT